MSESRIQEIAARLLADLDTEMFDKGYEITFDPDTRVSFGGSTRGMEGVFVNVGLDNQDTVQWLRNREMLSYETVYPQGDFQTVREAFCPR